MQTVKYANVTMTYKTEIQIHIYTYIFKYNLYEYYKGSKRISYWKWTWNNTRICDKYRSWHFMDIHIYICKDLRCHCSADNNESRIWIHCFKDPVTVRIFVNDILSVIIAALDSKATIAGFAF